MLIPSVQHAAHLLFHGGKEIVENFVELLKTHHFAPFRCTFNHLPTLYGAFFENAIGFGKKVDKGAKKFLAKKVRRIPKNAAGILFYGV
jgi:hypothetical protein